MLVIFGTHLVYYKRDVLAILLYCIVQKIVFSLPQTSAEFDWDPKLRGVILSAFFYGYVCTQLVGGTLATKLGGVKLMGYGILGTAIFTVLTPVVARCSVYLVIVLRIAEGVMEVVNNLRKL